MRTRLKREPVITWAAVAAAANSVQTQLHLHGFEHAAIVIITALAAAHQTRKRTTPA
jgi:hypothetical protein